MNLPIHNRIRTLIEETNDAFYACGSINADYAEFASLALADFKTALSDQSLTRSQLRKMLRGGMVACKDKDPDNWAVFMAQHMAQAANTSQQ